MLISTRALTKGKILARHEKVSSPPSLQYGTYQTSYNHYSYSYSYSHTDSKIDSRGKGEGNILPSSLFILLGADPNSGTYRDTLYHNMMRENS